MASAAFGVGAYTPSEAAKLLRMQPATLRRWLYGYDFDHGDGPREMPPLWEPQYGCDDDGPLLGFRDLVEARIVNGLRRSRIGLPTIRLCIDRAKEILGDHPFSTKAFKTDGRRIFLDITQGVEEPRLIDLKDRQHVFRAFVLPTLSGFEFGDAAVERWWLIPSRKTIVIDPERSFGQPIVADIGLLTSRVVQDVKAEGSVERVARLYETSGRAIRDALEFEAGELADAT
ncbi:hypothetical protein LVY65_05025 [Sphingomonas sp. G124]|uniref:DUF433 domain-containing protein n=1 Tax=Sphingomonas cremea TaxID=2904799 RepID=A0A9X1QM34_9SPHN|nr:hypothetical protein [Sphingomonas cremea]MCF2514428.1 hypothetical protein [Sphingomonas cremea]